MADHNVTLQTCSCKQTSTALAGANVQNPANNKSKQLPYTRQLTVLETATTPRARAQSVGVHYIPVQLEPCIVLSGKWIREAGFSSQQKIAVQVQEGQLNIKPIAESDGVAVAD